jgi:hypothetical protein
MIRTSTPWVAQAVLAANLLSPAPHNSMVAVAVAGYTADRVETLLAHSVALAETVVVEGERL